MWFSINFFNSLSYIFILLVHHYVFLLTYVLCNYNKYWQSWVTLWSLIKTCAKYGNLFYFLFLYHQNHNICWYSISQVCCWSICHISWYSIYHISSEFIGYLVHFPTPSPKYKKELPWKTFLYLSKKHFSNIWGRN